MIYWPFVEERILIWHPLDTDLHYMAEQVYAELRGWA